MKQISMIDVNAFLCYNSILTVMQSCSFNYAEINIVNELLTPKLFTHEITERQFVTVLTVGTGSYTFVNLCVSLGSVEIFTLRQATLVNFAVRLWSQFVNMTAYSESISHSLLQYVSAIVSTSFQASSQFYS